MKRKSYLIQYTTSEGVTGSSVKYAFNSAIRETEKLIDEINVNFEYHLVRADSWTKDSIRSKNYTDATRCWYTPCKTKWIIFTITKI